MVGADQFIEGQLAVTITVHLAEVLLNELLFAAQIHEIRQEHVNALLEDLALAERKEILQNFV